MKFPRHFALVACPCLAWSLTAYSGEAPETDLKTTAVAAFKDGLAFVVKQGDASLEDGVGNLSPVPNATLGSLRIASNDAGTSLDGVVAHPYKVSAQPSLTVLAEYCSRTPVRWSRLSITVKKNTRARSSGFGKPRN
jgi:hypothetical protein